MEILLVLLAAGVLWWWSRKRSAAKAMREGTTATFDAPALNQAVHFPSMTWAMWTLGGMGIIYAGPIRREDGPRWRVAIRRDRKTLKDWEDVALELASPLETAYQRFLHAELSPATTSLSAEQWLEHVRDYVRRLHNIDGAVIIGYDPDEAEAEDGAARQSA